MTRPEYPVFDGHNDTLTSLHRAERDEGGGGRGGGGRSFFVESDTGHIDLPRARRGGLAGGFFAVFVPQIEPSKADAAPRGSSARSESPLPAVDPAYALRFTNEIMAGLRRLLDEADGQVRLACTARDLTECLDHGTMAVVLHFEGAEAIHPDLGALENFYSQGLRSLGIVWSRPNIYGHGVPFDFPGSPDSGPGLTAAGVRLVHECNRLGILVDLSHLNERGFWDAAEHTGAPLVVTHAAAHALCPSPRNLTDRQMEAVAETHGVVGINFHVGFLREDGARDPDTPLEVLIRHIDHAVERMGVDHVALGSDFDGATMPLELGDAAGLPRLIDDLKDAGYDDAALRKLTHENWIRVLAATWK